ncbi:uncharacterized protein LOC125498678 [Beta vulgaris subsp. vulgaris]|uniref:uncharacterized protein LOC125498678 n=1 Tax=Beta vulgaris subsp. vulgaris TaxID=3555 RepID=UPI002036779C|nr:uncharacterized protein LOC125498678 [Beta vulgaris subsp. vulgaris]
MGENGVFVVRFHNMEDKNRALENGPILFDRKPVIMKHWASYVDLRKEDVKVVPTWIRLVNLPLKYWGQQTLHKLVGKVGKPIKTDRATAHKDILEYARVLVEVRVDQTFLKEISYVNEKGMVAVQPVHYECKPITCLECRGIGHTQEECGDKEKTIPLVATSNGFSCLATIAEGPCEGQVEEEEVKDQVSSEGQVNKVTEATDVMQEEGKSDKIGLCGLLETRVKSGNFPKVYSRVCEGWSVVTNHQQHRGGRIWVIWLPNVFHLDVIECHAQFIHCRVEHRSSNKSFCITFVYGMNDAQDREELWNRLSIISSKVKEAWVLVGDFNNVLHLNERLGSAVTLAKVNSFRECMRVCNLNEHSTEGPFFTWSNKQEGEGRVWCRIDRIIANDEWDSKWQKLLQNSYLRAEVVRPKAFRFFNMWAADDEFLSRVQGVWNENISGVPMYKVVVKLKKLKRVLKDLNKSKYASIESAADEAKLRMITIQESLQQEPTNERLHKEESEARVRYNALHKARYSFLQQKAKQEWLSKGDLNTHYFHACLKKRRLQNQISRIQDKQGV